MLNGQQMLQTLGGATPVAQSNLPEMPLRTLSCSMPVSHWQHLHSLYQQSFHAAGRVQTTAPLSRLLPLPRPVTTRS